MRRGSEMQRFATEVAMAMLDREALRLDDNKDRIIAAERRREHLLDNAWAYARGDRSYIPVQRFA